MNSNADNEELMFLASPGAELSISLFESDGAPSEIRVFGNRAGMLSLANILLWLHANSYRREFLSLTSLPFVLNHPQMVDCIAFSPDGRLLASGARDMIIRIWDVATGEELRQIKGSAGAVLDLMFSPDGRRLVSRAGKPPQFF